VVWMGANLDALLYSTASFLGGGVCGLRRCRSAIQLLELLVILSRTVVVWDFFCYHCHITLNGSIVVQVHCIVVYPSGSIFIYRRFHNLNTVLFYIHRFNVNHYLGFAPSFRSTTRKKRKVNITAVVRYAWYLGACGYCKLQLTTKILNFPFKNS